MVVTRYLVIWPDRYDLANVCFVRPVNAQFYNSSKESYCFNIESEAFSMQHRKGKDILPDKFRRPECRLLVGYTVRWIKSRKIVSHADEKKLSFPVECWFKIIVAQYPLPELKFAAVPMQYEPNVDEPEHFSKRPDNNRTYNPVSHIVHVIYIS